MGIAVKLNLSKWPARPLITDALLRDLGEMTLRLIRTRTMQGTDADGRAFAPYTPGYAELRAKEGMSTTPDLTVSGRMLNDMAVTGVANGSVSLGFTSRGGRAPRGKQTLIQRSRSVGAEDKAQWHNVDGAGRSKTIRKFFGLTPGDVGTIRTAVSRYLDNVVRAANGR